MCRRVIVTGETMVLTRQIPPSMPGSVKSYVDAGDSVWEQYTKGKKMFPFRVILQGKCRHVYVERDEERDYRVRLAVDCSHIDYEFPINVVIDAGVPV